MKIKCEVVCDCGKRKIILANKQESKIACDCGEEYYITITVFRLPKGD